MFGARIQNTPDKIFRGVCGESNLCCMLTRMPEPADKPRRAWFQIHLSTAIVLMFVAGGLMYFSASYYRYALDHSTWEGDKEPLFPWVRPGVVVLLTRIFHQ